jgi:hypothetical protein
MNIQDLRRTQASRARKHLQIMAIVMKSPVALDPVAKAALFNDIAKRRKVKKVDSIEVRELTEKYLSNSPPRRGPARRPFPPGPPGRLLGEEPVYAQYDEIIDVDLSPPPSPRSVRARGWVYVCPSMEHSEEPSPDPEAEREQLIDPLVHLAFWRALGL